MEVQSNGVVKQRGEAVLTYVRKRSRKRSRTSSEAAGSGSGSGSGEVLRDNFVDKDILQSSEDFQSSVEMPPEPNAYEKKRKLVQPSMPPSPQEDGCASIAPEKDSEVLIAVIENAGDSAVDEVVLRDNFVDKDISQSSEDFQSSVEIPPEPNAYEKKRKLVQPSMPPSLQEDGCASIAPEKDSEVSIAVIEKADSAVGEVLVDNFVNEGTPQSSEHFQGSVGIPPDPNAHEKSKQVETSTQCFVQEHSSASTGPKKDSETLNAVIENAGDSAVGKVLVDTFVNKGTSQLSEHFQASVGIPPDPNAHEKRKQIVVSMLPHSLQEYSSVSITPEKDSEAPIDVIKNAGDSAVNEVLVDNFVNVDTPQLSDHFQASVGIAINPDTYEKKREQVDLSKLPSLQEDQGASVAPKKDIEDSVVLVEDAGDLAICEVSDIYSPKQRNRDIGWDHGARVAGNSYRWKCNWCGIIRWGGVCRLKQHLAGAPQVRKCPNVPEHIAELMREHLNPGVLRAIEAINSRSPWADGFDKAHMFRGSDISESKASHGFTKGKKRSKINEKLPGTITQRSEMAIVKAVEEPLEAQDALDRTDSHWINALEHMLQLPDDDGRGIRSSIQSALRSGPSICTTKSKDRFKDYYEVQDHSQIFGSSAGAASDTSKSGPCCRADISKNSLKCQNILSKVLRSKSFVSLCNLIFGTFRERKACEVLNFSLINTKMINGDYERSPEKFDQDIGQVWDKIRKIGQDMTLLASNLSNISPTSSPKQAREDLVQEVGEQIFEDTCHVGVEQRNSMESNTIQFPSYESDRSTKPELTEASCMYKICTCKVCGTDADGNHSVICDGCEAVYHLSCIEPGQQKIPTQNWYCAACVMNRKKPPAPTNRRGISEPSTNIRRTSEPASTSLHPEGLHRNCAVCDRLEVSDTRGEANEIGNMSVMVIDSRASSVSSQESYDLPEPSRTAVLRLCKKCGSCEDDDRRFLICAHTHCPYKFYHIRCLKYSQTVCLQKRNYSCWYCPSCLCRSCLSDKDDDQIVLCDSCDEGYHTYCMKPPHDSIPKGQWYCISCTAARAKEGMRRYEQMILQQHDKKDGRHSSEANMDMLLSAVEKVSSEDQVTVGGEDR